MGLYTMLVVALVVVAIIASRVSANKGTNYLALALWLSITGSMVSWWVLGSYFWMIPVYAVTILIVSCWSSPLAHAINVMYGIRSVLVVLVQYEVISVSIYQEVNSWFVIAQAIIALWGAARNGGIRLNDNKGDIAGHGTVLDMAFSVSKKIFSGSKKST